MTGVSSQILVWVFSCRIMCFRIILIDKPAASVNSSVTHLKTHSTWTLNSETKARRVLIRFTFEHMVTQTYKHTRALWKSRLNKWTTYCRFGLLLQNKRGLKHKCCLSCLCRCSVSRSAETENKVGKSVSAKTPYDKTTWINLNAILRRDNPTVRL